MPSPVAEMSDLGRKDIATMYKPSDFLDWESSHFRSPKDWLETGWETSKDPNGREGDKYLPRKPEDATVETDANGIQLKMSDGRPLVTPQNKWCYHYGRHCFTSATHMVLYEDATESSIPLDKFAQEGRIFANGGQLSFDRITDWIQRGKATVMLLNTGGVAHSFGSLHHWCVTKKGLLESIEKDPAKRCSLILEKVAVVSQEPWTRKFGLSQILMMQDLEKRAPDTMRKSIVVVDGLREGPEEVVERLTGCFASAGLGLPELGIGTAEEDVVIEAWKMHMTLVKAGKIYRRYADITYFVALMLGLVSSFLAVLLGATEQKNADGSMGALLVPDKSTSRHAFEQILIVVPLATGALGAFNSLTRYLQKWGAVTTAAGQIVREIYQFRTHVIEYNPIPADADKKAMEEEEEDDGKAGMDGTGPQVPRKVFVKKVQSIYRATLEMLGNDAMEEAWSGVTALDDEDNFLFKEKLRSYVPRNVLNAGPYYADGGNVRNIQLKKGIFMQMCAWMSALAACIRGCCRKKKEEEGETLDDDAKPIQIGIEADDYVSPMQIETYVEYRLRVKLALLQKHALILSAWLMRLETAVILVTAFGTLLAGVERHAWIALTVSFAGVIANITQYKCLQSRLSATNAAISDLRTVMISMDSLSIVEKRTTGKKTYCVAIVESAIFNTITAWTGAGVSAQDGESAEEGNHIKAD